MIKRWPSIIVAVALAGGGLLLLAASVQAAVPNWRPAAGFHVNSTVDSPDADKTDGQCLDQETIPKCSLRSALQQLDHDSGGIIYLPVNIYNLTDNTDGDLQINADIQIYGTGIGQAAIVGGASWHHRIMRVQNGAELVLVQVALTGGHAPNGNGGGLDIVSGTVTLEDLAVNNNEAGYGGGIYNAGRLSLSNVNIASNLGITEGGGLYNSGLGSSPNLTISLSALTQNNSNGPGGGLYNLGHAVVTTSTLDGNIAVAGGGVTNRGPGVLTLAASIISNNFATANVGGGVENFAASAQLDVINSTFTSNTAAFEGGALYNYQGSVDLSSVTVVSNTGNTLHNLLGSGGGLYNNATDPFALRNTLVAFNHDWFGAGPDCDGQFNSQSYNLVLTTTGCSLTNNTTGNIIGKDPQLTGLGNYHGSTLVWGLRFSSPAVDAGNPAGCRDRHNNVLTVDQEGAARPTDGNGDGVAGCDIGAYELQLARLFVPLVRR